MLVIGDQVTLKDLGPGVIQDVIESNYYVILENGASVEAPISELEQSQEPFLAYTCDCGQEIRLMEELKPGQAAVERCTNCDESWTFVVPPIEAYKTSEYEPIWKHIAQ